MDPRHLLQKLVQWTKEKPAYAIAAAVCLVLLLAAAISASRPTRVSTTYYDVRRGDFLVSIVEGGSIQAVNEVVIRSEVEGVARVIYIVPEGTYVRKGDLLVELDSSSARDQLNQQQINHEKATFALTQAREQLEIQKSVVDSEVRAAELKVEFAKTDLNRYLEGEAMQERRKIEVDMTSISENMTINQETFKWTEQLEKEGFETKNKLDRDRLAVLQSKLNFEMASNSLWMLETFDYPKKKRQLEAAVEEAEKELERVKLTGQRRLAQYEADLRTQQNTLDLSKNKLERDQRQLAASKIYAPQDGLVVYAVSESHFSSESLIEEGATVRNRQELIKLPDISEMKLGVKVHESQVNLVKVGQPAYVVLDSMPDERFRGVVSKVALLPDTQSRWGNPNLKVYATEILITDPLPDVKPGVSARAEIVITNIQDVLTVPVQAVTTKRGRPVVYVAKGNSAEPAPVEVGLYNTKFIQLTSGVQEGDRVLLSPPFDTEEKDLGGAILAAGDADAITNFTVRTPPNNGRRRNGGESAGPAASAAGRTGPAPPAMADAMSPNPGGGSMPAGGSFPGREERLKQFDKNGDGQLDESEREAMRSQMGARLGGPRLSRDEMLKQFDKNGDGEIDESEREAMRSQMGARFGGPRLSREEILKQFDKNGDGELDDEERAAMRAATGGGVGGRGAAPAEEQGQGAGQGRRDRNRPAGSERGTPAAPPPGS